MGSWHSSASYWSRFDSKVAVPTHLPYLKLCSASQRVMVECSQFFMMDAQSFQITSINPILLCYPPPFGSSTIITHVSATGRCPSWNASFVKLTSFSHRCVSVSFPALLPLATPAGSLPSPLMYLPPAPCTDPILPLLSPPPLGVRLGSLLVALVSISAWTPGGAACRYPHSELRYDPAPPWWRVVLGLPVPQLDYAPHFPRLPCCQ